jgi:hypothetical protein
MNTRAANEECAIFRGTSAGRRGRACRTRWLGKRMLIEFVCGTWETYGDGPSLTPHGEQIARSVCDHAAREQRLNEAAEGAHNRTGQPHSMDGNRPPIKKLKD